MKVATTDGLKKVGGVRGWAEHGCGHHCNDRSSVSAYYMTGRDRPSKPASIKISANCTKAVHG